MTGVRRMIVVLVLAAVALISSACSIGRDASNPSATVLPDNSENTASASPDPSSGSTPSADDSPPSRNAQHAGIKLTARAMSDGTFDITEVVLLADPTQSVTLRPPDLRLLDNVLGHTRPVATDVQLTAGDRRVRVPGDTIRTSTSLALLEPTRRIELRYRMSGVTRRSKPSTAGRALAAVGPLITDVPPDLPVSVAVPGRSVRNLECPTLDATRQACAVGPPNAMRIDQPLPCHAALVMVQLDLS
jgi:hypothetical protein